MAQNLQQLNRRRKTALNIAQVARAMEMISASKIKRAQNAVENNRPYAERISNLTTTLLRHVDLTKFSHLYLKGGNSQNSLLIIISPDKGLCGSLNTNLAKKLLETETKNKKIVTLGKKAYQFSRMFGGEAIANFNFGTTLPSYSVVFQLIEIINQEYASGSISKVQVLFSEFKSIFIQDSVIKTILPIETAAQDDQLPYIFEPKVESLLSELLPYYVEVLLYRFLLEAFTSEQAARMVAMQNAKNNALDIADYLTLSYNKSRQERITNELLTLAVH